MQVQVRQTGFDMKFEISRHARNEMNRRGVSENLVQTILQNPGQIVDELEATMKITYDPEVDVLRIIFSNTPIEESDEEKPGIILDFDKSGNVVYLSNIRMEFAKTRTADAITVTAAKGEYSS